MNTSRYNPGVIHATLNNDQARAVAIRANGVYADVVTHSRAADAINAKASSLRYGSQP